MSKKNVPVVPASYVIAEVEEGSLRYLEGKILTIIDAIGLPEVQLKAIKELVAHTLWGWSYEKEKCVVTLGVDGKIYTNKGDKWWDIPVNGN